MIKRLLLLKIAPFIQTRSSWRVKQWANMQGPYLQFLNYNHKKRKKDFIFDFTSNSTVTTLLITPRQSNQETIITPASYFNVQFIRSRYSTWYLLNRLFHIAHLIRTSCLCHLPRSCRSANSMWCQFASAFRHVQFVWSSNLNRRISIFNELYWHSKNILDIRGMSNEMTFWQMTESKMTS